MLDLGLIVVCFIVFFSHAFFNRKTHKSNDSILSAAVEGSERYIMIGLVTTVLAFLQVPRVPRLQGIAAVFAGALLGLLMAHRYVARAESQLGLRQQIEPPFVARFEVWSLSWWVLLLIAIVFLVFGLPRTPELFAEAALFGGSTVFADGVYAWVWLRLHRSLGQAKVPT